MKIFTVLYGHFSKVLVTEGQILKYQDKIGIMGDTGDSRGAHLHCGVIDGARSTIWRLANMAAGNPVANQTESKWFADHDIFIGQDGEKRRTIITTAWLGYKDHYAYDIIDDGRGLPYIVWNRGATDPIPGKVVKTGYDGGYGYYVIVQYSYSAEFISMVKAGDLVQILPAGLDTIGKSTHLVIDHGDIREGYVWVRVGVKKEDVKKVK